MKTILVTGGAGFIGSHTVVELINSGYQPIIVDNFDNSSPFVLDNIKKITGISVPFYELDCNEPQFEEVFKTHKIDGIIHFAANKAVGESVENPLKYYKNNIGSLVLLLELMNKHSVTNLVFSSSCTVYGEPKELPVTESTPRQKANSPYGNTKSISEDILTDATTAHKNLRAIALRYFNPIGAHPSSLLGELPIGKPNNLVPFITQTAIGKRDELTVFGNNYPTNDGTCIRDYIHVIDLAKAHIKAFEYLSNNTNINFDIFNIGTGNGNSVLEVIHAFEKVSNQKLKYKFGPIREGDVVAVYANVDKSKNVLNWSAEINIEDALLHAWNWEKWLKENKSIVNGK